MRLLIRSLVVLAVGCAVAAGGYLALGSLPMSALGGVAGGHGHRGGSPAEFAAAGAEPPADAAQFRAERGAGEFGDRRTRGGREGFGGREGHGEGFGVLGVFKDLTQIGIVTALVMLLGWAVRSRGRDRMTPAADSA